MFSRLTHSRYISRHRNPAEFFAFLIIGLLLPAISAEAGRPEPPRAWVDTSYPVTHGRTIAVREGGNLQRALEHAQPGDVIELQPGATYRGPFTLPAKRGSGWIIVKSADPAGKLPASGTRVSPKDAAAMPKLEARRGAVLTTASGASHFRFVGIEIRPEPRRFLHNLVYLDPGSGDEGDLPHHIIFDRCYIHGDPDVGTRRGIAMNSRYTAVIDSHLSGFKEQGADSQAIAGWNGPGPFKIVNSRIEGAGENLMFGGADPSIDGLVPADIEIRGNHFIKPLEWRIDDPEYAGTPWTVKNLFELKNARRVFIEGNLFEYNWAHAQTGYAILFTVRNQGGSAPWSVVEDVNFTNNIVRHVSNGIVILGTDDNHESNDTRRIRVANNLFYDIGGQWEGGVFLLMTDGTRDVVIEHNSVFHSGSILISGEGRPHTGFEFIGNIVSHNEYGMIGDGTGPGRPTLERFFPDAVVTENLIVGGRSDLYPRGNAFPRTPRHVESRDSGDRSLRPDELGIDGGKARSGRGPGVDYTALCKALAAHGQAPAGEIGACRNMQ
jgi:hypothetical protein